MTLFKPIKTLGQNFLTDIRVAYAMIEALELKNNDTVVEIGPGLGFITKILCDELIDKNAELFAIELDERFVQKLKIEFDLNTNLHVIHSNILDWLPFFYPIKESFKILGAIPYYITSPIIHQIVRLPIKPSISVLLLQNEVAEKITGKAPISSYMSSLVQTFFDAYYVQKVERTKFDPAPKVDGAIIKLSKKAEQEIPYIDTRKYEQFLHRAYSNPRKMLNKVFTGDELKKGGINSGLRPQNYNWYDWVKIYKSLLN